MFSTPDPAVYPLGLLELYPSSVAESPISDAQQVNGEVESYISVALSALYPAIDLCEFVEVRTKTLSDVVTSDAPVYPYNLEAIYPVKVGSMSKRLRSKRTLSSNNALPFQPRGMRPNKHTSLLLFGQTAGARTVEDVPPVPKLPENIHQLRPISPWTGLPLREEVSGKMTGNEVSMRYPTICLCELACLDVTFWQALISMPHRSGCLPSLCAVPIAGRTHHDSGTFEARYRHHEDGTAVPILTNLWVFSSL